VVTEVLRFSHFGVYLKIAYSRNHAYLVEVEAYFPQRASPVILAFKKYLIKWKNVVEVI